MPTNKRRTPQQWQVLVVRQRASGLSIAEFARQQDLKYQTFFRWCSKLSAADIACSDVAMPEFIEISGSSAPEAQANEWLGELELGNGVCLRVRRTN